MKKVEIRDLLTYRFPENLLYSPDGKYLAFSCAQADEKKNSYKRDIWLIKDGKPVQLTTAFSSSAVLWDDETHLIIRREKEEDDPGMHVLYCIDVNGSEAYEWMRLPAAPQQIVKAADNTYVFTASIMMSDPDAYRDNEETRKKKAEEKKKDSGVQVVDEIPYWFNGAGFVNGTRTALFLLKTDGKPILKRLTAPSFDTSGFRVKDKTVYYTGNTRNRKMQLSSKIYSYDIETGRKTTLYGRNDCMVADVIPFDNAVYALANDMKSYGFNQTPDFMKIENGKLVFAQDPHRQFGGSMVCDTLLGGGKTSVLKNGRYYVLATEEDHEAIWKYDSSLNKTVVYEKDSLIPFFDVHDGKLAFVQLLSDRLAEVYEMDEAGTVRQLTDFNSKALEGKYIAKPQRIDYESNGEPLHGWVLLPQNYKNSGKVPAVLDIHGGPRCVYGTVFFHEMQVWANEGYAVMFTNIPGSDGRDDEFADLQGKMGTVDFDALMSFADAVLAAYPGIDPQRVCETGGSYGGFMTNWIITHTDRFCCAASQRSISNWVSFSFISDIGPFFGPDQSGADGLFSDENTAKLWERSPLRYAQQCHTPTLFIHSDEDYRCPLPEGMQMMQALAYQNVDTRMVIFHGENHDLSRSGKPLNRIRRLEEITAWFRKYTSER